MSLSLLAFVVCLLGMAIFQGYKLLKRKLLKIGLVAEFQLHGSKVHIRLYSSKGSTCPLVSLKVSILLPYLRMPFITVGSVSSSTLKGIHGRASTVLGLRVANVELITKAYNKSINPSVLETKARTNKGDLTGKLTWADRIVWILSYISVSIEKISIQVVGMDEMSIVGNVILPTGMYFNYHLPRQMMTGAKASVSNSFDECLEGRATLYGSAAAVSLHCDDMEISLLDNVGKDVLKINLGFVADIVDFTDECFRATLSRGVMSLDVVRTVVTLDAPALLKIMSSLPACLTGATISGTTRAQIHPRKYPLPSTSGQTSILTNTAKPISTSIFPFVDLVSFLLRGVTHKMLRDTLTICLNSTAVCVRGFGCRYEETLSNMKFGSLESPQCSSKKRMTTETESEQAMYLSLNRVVVKLAVGERHQMQYISAAAQSMDFVIDLDCYGNNLNRNHMELKTHRVGRILNLSSVTAMAMELPVTLSRDLSNRQHQLERAVSVTFGTFCTEYSVSTINYFVSMGEQLNVFLSKNRRPRKTKPVKAAQSWKLLIPVLLKSLAYRVEGDTMALILLSNSDCERTCIFSIHALKASYAGPTSKTRQRCTGQTSDPINFETKIVNENESENGNENESGSGSESESESDSESGSRSRSRSESEEICNIFMEKISLTRFLPTDVVSDKGHAAIGPTLKTFRLSDMSTWNLQRVLDITDVKTTLYKSTTNQTYMDAYTHPQTSANVELDVLTDEQIHANSCTNLNVGNVKATTRATNSPVTGNTNAKDEKEDTNANVCFSDYRKSYSSLNSVTAADLKIFAERIYNSDVRAGNVIVRLSMPFMYRMLKLLDHSIEPIVRLKAVLEVTNHRKSSIPTFSKTNGDEQIQIRQPHAHTRAHTDSQTQGGVSWGEPTANVLTFVVECMAVYVVTSPNTTILIEAEKELEMCARVTYANEKADHFVTVEKKQESCTNQSVPHLNLQTDESGIHKSSMGTRDADTFAHTAIHQPNHSPKLSPVHSSIAEVHTQGTPVRTLERNSRYRLTYVSMCVPAVVGSVNGLRIAFLDDFRVTLGPDDTQVNSQRLLFKPRDCTHATLMGARANSDTQTDTDSSERKTNIGSSTNYASVDSMWMGEESVMVPLGGNGKMLLIEMYEFKLKLPFLYDFGKLVTEIQGLVKVAKTGVKEIRETQIRLMVNGKMGKNGNTQSCETEMMDSFGLRNGKKVEKTKGARISISVRAKNASLLLLNDNFEAKLARNYEVSLDEQVERSIRENMLAEKIKELNFKDENNVLLHTSQLEDALLESHSTIYKQRIQQTPIQKDALLTTIYLQDLDLTLHSDNSMLEHTQIQSRMRCIDPRAPYPPEDSPLIASWDTLLGFKVSLSANSGRLSFFDFDKDFVSIAKTSIYGTLILAEAEPPTKEGYISRNRELHDGLGVLEGSKKLSVLKFFYELQVNTVRCDVVWGPSLDAALTSFSQSIDKLSTPSSGSGGQKLSSWDKCRLLFHGRLLLQADVLEVLIQSNLSPFTSHEGLAITANQMSGKIGDGDISVEAHLNVWVQSSTKYHKCPLLSIHDASLNLHWDWVTEKDCMDHYSVNVLSPEFTAHIPDYDPYQGFRSTSIVLTLTLNVVNPDGTHNLCDTTSSDSSTRPQVFLYARLIRWLSDFIGIFKRKNLQIRNGKYWGGVRSRKAGLGKSISKFIIDIQFPSGLLAQYWIDTAQEKGLLVNTESVIFYICMVSRRKEGDFGNGAKMPDSKIRHQGTMIWTMESIVTRIAECVITVNPGASETEPITEDCDILGFSHLLTCQELVYERTPVSEEEDWDAPPRHRIQINNSKISWTKNKYGFIFGLIDMWQNHSQLQQDMSPRVFIINRDDMDERKEVEIDDDVDLSSSRCKVGDEVFSLIDEMLSVNNADRTVNADQPMDTDADEDTETPVNAAAVESVIDQHRKPVSRDLEVVFSGLQVNFAGENGGDNGSIIATAHNATLELFLGMPLRSPRGRLIVPSYFKGQFKAVKLFAAPMSRNDIGTTEVDRLKWVPDWFITPTFHPDSTDKITTPLSTHTDTRTCTQSSDKNTIEQPNTHVEDAASNVRRSYKTSRDIVYPYECIVSRGDIGFLRTSMATDTDEAAVLLKEAVTQKTLIVSPSDDHTVFTSDNPMEVTMKCIIPSVDIKCKSIHYNSLTDIIQQALDRKKKDAELLQSVEYALRLSNIDDFRPGISNMQEQMRKANRAIEETERYIYAASSELLIESCAVDSKLRHQLVPQPRPETQSEANALINSRIHTRSYTRSQNSPRKSAEADSILSIDADLAAVEGKRETASGSTYSYTKAFVAADKQSINDSENTGSVSGGTHHPAFSDGGHLDMRSLASFDISDNKSNNTLSELATLFDLLVEQKEMQRVARTHLRVLVSLHRSTRKERNAMIEGMSDRATTRLATTEIIIDDAKWRLLDDDQYEFLTFGITSFKFSSVALSDLSTATTLSAEGLSGKNKVPNDYYSEILQAIDSGASGEKSAHTGFDRNLVLRVYSRSVPPVGGIDVKEHFEINVAPLEVKLTYRLTSAISSFFFPDDAGLFVVANGSTLGSASNIAWTTRDTDIMTLEMGLADLRNQARAYVAMEMRSPNLTQPKLEKTRQVYRDIIEEMQLLDQRIKVGRQINDWVSKNTSRNDIAQSSNVNLNVCSGVGSVDVDRSVSLTHKQETDSPVVQKRSRSPFRRRSKRMLALSSGNNTAVTNIPDRNKKSDTDIIAEDTKDEVSLLPKSIGVGAHGLPLLSLHDHLQNPAFQQSRGNRQRAQTLSLVPQSSPFSRAQSIGLGGSHLEPLKNTISNRHRSHSFSAPADKDLKLKQHADNTNMHVQRQPSRTSTDLLSHAQQQGASQVDADLKRELKKESSNLSSSVSTTYNAYTRLSPIVSVNTFEGEMDVERYDAKYKDEGHCRRQGKSTPKEENGKYFPYGIMVSKSVGTHESESVSNGGYTHENVNVECTKMPITSPAGAHEAFQALEVVHTSNNLDTDNATLGTNSSGAVVGLNHEGKTGGENPTEDVYSSNSISLKSDIDSPTLLRTAVPDVLAPPPRPPPPSKKPSCYNSAECKARVSVDSLMTVQSLVSNSNKKHNKDERSPPPPRPPPPASANITKAKDSANGGTRNSYSIHEDKVSLGAKAVFTSPQTMLRHKRSQSAIYERRDPIITINPSEEDSTNVKIMGEQVSANIPPGRSATVRGLLREFYNDTSLRVDDTTGVGLKSLHSYTKLARLDSATYAQLLQPPAVLKTISNLHSLRSAQRLANADIRSSPDPPTPTMGDVDRQHSNNIHLATPFIPSIPTPGVSTSKGKHYNVNPSVYLEVEFHRSCSTPAANPFEEAMRRTLQSQQQHQQQNTTQPYLQVNTYQQYDQTSLSCVSTGGLEVVSGKHAHKRSHSYVHTRPFNQSVPTRTIHDSESTMNAESNLRNSAVCYSLGNDEHVVTKALDSVSQEMEVGRNSERLPRSTTSGDEVGGLLVFNGLMRSPSQSMMSNMSMEDLISMGATYGGTSIVGSTSIDSSCQTMEPNDSRENPKPNSKDSLPATAIPAHRKNKTKRVQDVDTMRKRATTNISFVYVKVPKVGVRLSYRAGEGDMLFNVDGFWLSVPTLEYHDRTWTWKDMLEQIKKDCVAQLISQVVKQKMGVNKKKATVANPSSTSLGENGEMMWPLDVEGQQREGGLFGFQDLSKAKMLLGRSVSKRVKNTKAMMKEARRNFAHNIDGVLEEVTEHMKHVGPGGGGPSPGQSDEDSSQVDHPIEQNLRNIPKSKSTLSSGRKRRNFSSPNENRNANGSGVQGEGALDTQINRQLNRESSSSANSLVLSSQSSISTTNEQRINLAFRRTRSLNKPRIREHNNSRDICISRNNKDNSQNTNMKPKSTRSTMPPPIPPPYCKSKTNTAQSNVSKTGQMDE
eukprot:CFRG1801T1